MHTFSETGTGVPAFLAKLWRLVEDPETNHLIYWNRDGRSFIIQNQAQFARELLPMNYKHNNMASFIRQLNMYGFHKITSIENGGLKFDRDEMEFSHPCFKRGYPYLLEHIKRKIATAKTIDDKSNVKPEAVSKVLNEVKVMRGRQDSLDSRFSAMKQENEALWREIAVLRQKHMKQQQIVNKLIQFLVTIVQPQRNMTGVKRNFQLMINDVPQSTKVRKRHDSNSGPIIHELTEELLDEVTADSDEDLLPGSPHVMSPRSNRTDVHDTDEMPRPQSTASIGSLQESNLGDEFISSPRTIGSTSQTPDPENDSIIYQITEIPENNDFIDEYMLQQSANTASPEQQKMTTTATSVRPTARRGRKRKHIETETNEQQIGNADDAGPSSKPIQDNGNGNAAVASGNNLINIKKEKDIDPLSFLENTDQAIVDQELMRVLDPAGTSRNRSSNVTATTASGQQNSDKQMYITQDDFISNEMPVDLFEESPMVGGINLASGIYNPNIDITRNRDGTNSENSTGAAISSSSPSTSTTNAGEDASHPSMSVAKYTSDDIMRLSTPHDFNTHLDTVQGDLESLRDLLRSEGYSFDANTLLNNGQVADRLILHPGYDTETLAKLFNDSDVLGPYGLQLGNEAPVMDNTRKGNELISYQPNYYSGDLSDMLNLESDGMSKDSEYDEKQTRNNINSVLNTPMPERD